MSKSTKSTLRTCSGKPLSDPGAALGSSKRGSTMINDKYTPH